MSIQIKRHTLNNDPEIVKSAVAYLENRSKRFIVVKRRK